MSDPAKVSPNSSLAGDLISDQRLGSVVFSCPIAKCGVNVYISVDAESRPGLSGVPTQVQKTDGAEEKGPAGKPTGGEGVASYPGLSVGTYKATVTLTADQLKDFAWPGTDEALAEDTKSVGPLETKLFPFVVDPLARPKIKVVWRATEEALGRPREEGDPEDGKAVPGIHVKLGDAINYPDTNGEGIAELEKAQKGLRPGDYAVNLTFDKDDLELMDGRSIAVAKGSKEIETFHVRPCWVEFAVLDPAKKAWEGEADFVLTYPEGKKTETGTLTADKKGKLRRAVPPGEYKFELKLLYEAKWTDPSAEIEKPITLRVQATGHELGDIEFDIFDGGSPTGVALDTVKASALNGKDAEVAWTPKAAKLTGVKSGTVRFIAKAGKSKAVSAAIPITGEQVIKVTGTDDLPFKVDMTIHFGDGDTMAVSSDGGEAKPQIPLGKQIVAIELAGQAGRIAAFSNDVGPLSTFFPT